MSVTSQELQKLKDAYLSADAEMESVWQRFLNSGNAIKDAEEKLNALVEQRRGLAADGNKEALAALRVSIGTAEDDLLIAQEAKPALLERAGQVLEKLFNAENAYNDALIAYWTDKGKRHIQAGIDAAKPHFAEAIKCIVQHGDFVFSNRPDYVTDYFFQVCDFNAWYEETIKSGEVKRGGDFSLVESKYVMPHERKGRNLHKDFLRSHK